MKKEKVEIKTGEKKKTDRKVLSFFLIMSITFMIMMVSTLWDNDFKSFILMIALAFYQAVMLNQFLESYYGENDI